MTSSIIWRSAARQGGDDRVKRGGAEGHDGSVPFGMRKGTGHAARATSDQMSVRPVGRNRSRCPDCGSGVGGYRQIVAAYGGHDQLLNMTGSYTPGRRKASAKFGKNCDSARV